MQHVQTRSTTSALVLTAVLIALATLLTMYTKIPVPGIRGYFNVGDVVIMTSALLLGRKYGAYIGAIGPALADLFLGYAYTYYRGCWHVFSRSFLVRYRHYLPC